MSSTNKGNLKPVEIFYQLQGVWTMDRTFGSNQGTFVGRAIFTPISFPDPALCLTEEGILQQGLQTFQATRSYIYILKEQQIHVHFRDGSSPGGFMHGLSFLSGDSEYAVAQHRCGEDTYTGTYHFIKKDRFSLTYQVCGPKKCNSIHTDFRRLPRGLSGV